MKINPTHTCQKCGNGPDGPSHRGEASDAAKDEATALGAATDAGSAIYDLREPLSNEALAQLAQERGMKLVPASAMSDLEEILREIIGPRVVEHQENEARVRALPYEGSDLVAIYSARCDEAEQIERLIRNRFNEKSPTNGGARSSAILECAQVAGQFIDDVQREIQTGYHLEQPSIDQLVGARTILSKLQDHLRALSWAAGVHSKKPDQP